MRLYHGSKKGIKGSVRPDFSRSMCDFGTGFYLGDVPEQPMGLIADWENHRFYDGTLCDKALIDGLLRVKLGNQYVLKTNKACSDAHLRIGETYIMAVLEEETARRYMNDLGGIKKIPDYHGYGSGFLRGCFQTAWRSAGQ